MSKSLIQRIKATIQRSSKEKESTISSLEDAQNIEAAFKMFDTNNDGFIDTEEAKSLLEKLLKRSPTKTQLDNLFNTVDLDKDGRISLQEFSTMMNDRKNKQEAHKRLFAEYDTNHDGYISKEELHEGLGKIGVVEGITDEDIEIIISYADKNKDQHIDYKEFLEYFL